MTFPAAQRLSRFYRITAARSARIEWSKNDRIILKLDENEYYVATVTRIKKEGRKLILRVKYDDGSGEWINSRSKYIIGRTPIKRKKLTGISKSDLRKWKLDTGEPSHRIVKDPPDVKPDATADFPWRKLEKAIAKGRSDYFEMYDDPDREDFASLDLLLKLVKERELDTPKFARLMGRMNYDLKAFVNEILEMHLTEDQQIGLWESMYG